MDWIEQRMRQHREYEHEHASVKIVADEMYGELWKAILEVTKADSLHGQSITCNGSPLHHSITFGARTVKIKLDDDRQGITATMPESPAVELKLRFCGDTTAGEVCLKHNGKVVDYKGAARLIMEPFLFEGGSPLAVPGAGCAP